MVWKRSVLMWQICSSQNLSFRRGKIKLRLSVPHIASVLSFFFKFNFNWYPHLKISCGFSIAGLCSLSGFGVLWLCWLLFHPHECCSFIPDTWKSNISHHFFFKSLHLPTPRAVVNCVCYWAAQMPNLFWNVFSPVFFTKVLTGLLGGVYCLLNVTYVCLLMWQRVTFQEFKGGWKKIETISLPYFSDPFASTVHKPCKLNSGNWTAKVVMIFSV